MVKKKLNLKDPGIAKFLLNFNTNDISCAGIGSIAKNKDTISREKNLSNN